MVIHGLLYSNWHTRIHISHVWVVFRYIVSFFKTSVTCGKIVIHRSAKQHAYKTRDAIAEKLTPYLRALEDIHDSGKAVDFQEIQHVMKPLHREALNRYQQKCKELRVSVIDVFLGLVHLPIDDIWNVQLDQKQLAAVKAARIAGIVKSLGKQTNKYSALFCKTH